MRGESIRWAAAVAESSLLVGVFVSGRFTFFGSYKVEPEGGT